MRLTSLSVDGLKSLREVELDVPQLLALSGPNGAGKTARLQALKLGILGCDPSVGRTLAATRKLAGGKGDIEVRLAFDNGFGIRRSFGRSLETELAPPRGESTERALQERINEETGAFVLSFDLESFLGLSPEKRRESLFGLLPRELAHLDQELFRRWLGYTDAEDVIKRAIDKLWQERLQEAQSPVEGLASAIEFARARFLEADSERQGQEKVTRAAEAEAEDMTAEAGAVDPDKLDALQVELSVLERQIGSIRERKAALDRAVRVTRENQERLAFTEKRIQEGDAHVRRLVDERDGVVGPRPAELELAIAAVDTARQKIQAKIGAASDASSQLTAARRRLEEARTELAKIEDLESCPVCGSTADLAIARERLRGRVDAEQQAYRGLAETANTAQEALRDAHSALHVAEGEHRRLKDVTDRLTRLTRDLRQAELLLEGIRAEKRALEGRVVETPEPLPANLEQDLRDLEDKASELRESIRKEQEAARAIGKAEGAQERADRQRTALRVLSFRTTALKDLYQGLQKLRAHVIKEMVGPVEVVANELLQEIDPAKTFRFIFERENRDTFDLGFEEGGVFRSYDAASTGEDAFLAVVFVAALIAAVRPPWSVLVVDNAESIDDLRRAELLSALGRVADRFGNIIIAGCCDFEAVPGWEIVDVRSPRLELVHG